ncbi:MAG: hypothetical protein WB987_15515 [Candidatus Acidiferrales bacterium]
MAGILVLCTIAAGILAYYFLRPKPNHRLDAIKQDIQSKIRTGMTRAEVEPFLTQRGIEHSYFPDIDKSGNPHMSRSETGMIRGKSDGLGVRSDIQLTFEFDESEKLTKYPIQEVFTGP